MMLRRVLAIVACARIAHADAAPGERCDIGPYLSPALMIGLGSETPAPKYVPARNNIGAAHGELAAGVIVRRCDADRLAATHVRLGAVLYVTDIDWPGASHPTGGIGLEAQVDRPIAPHLRLGGQAQVASAEHGAAFLTIGARVHYDDWVWLGADVFHVSNPSSSLYSCTTYATLGCASRTTGVMVGFGFEGRIGNYAGAAGLVGLAIGAIAIAAALGGVH